jgi:hypothetical protein
MNERQQRLRNRVPDYQQCCFVKMIVMTQILSNDQGGLPIVFRESTLGCYHVRAIWQSNGPCPQVHNCYRDVPMVTRVAFVGSFHFETDLIYKLGQVPEVAIAVAFAKAVILSLEPYERSNVSPASKEEWIVALNVGQKVPPGLLQWRYNSEPPLATFTIEKGWALCPYRWYAQT